VGRDREFMGLLVALTIAMGSRERAYTEKPLEQQCQGAQGFSFVCAVPERKYKRSCQKTTEEAILKLKKVLYVVEDSGVATFTHG
jgi:hypothetical protein